MSASGDVTILPSSCLSAPWPPTRPPAPTPTRPREWTWPTASPTCGSKPRSTAWTRCPRSTERRGRGWGGGRRGRGGDPLCRRTPADGTPSLGWEPPQHTHGASIAFTPICKNVGQRVMQDFPPKPPSIFFYFDFFFTSSWASLNSRLYKKKTSLLDAVAEYLRSFYMCDCDWSGGRVFHFCCFPISELVLDGDAWTDYVDFSSSLQLWDKITHQVRDFSFFFLLESTTNWHRLLTFMHFFFKRKVSFVFPHFFPFYTTDQQTFSTHFDSHVIVQYKGEANCISESKTSRFS